MLEEAEVANLTTPKIFKRGRDLFDEHAIIEPVKQGLVLRAQCDGSDYEPYDIKITLDEDGIVEAACTCPYEWEGMCKHCVAVALCWVHTPEEFRRIAPLEELLEKLDRTSLQKLVVRFVEEDPGLLSLVEAANTIAATAKEEANKDALDADDLVAYRTQVQTTFKKLARTLHIDWHSNMRRANRELEMLRATASGLIKAKARLKAAAYDAILLDELIRRYDEIQQLDEEGTLSAMAEECSGTISRAIPTAKDAERQEWLMILLRSEIHSHINGGLELPAASLRTVIQCDAKDWPALEAYIHRHIDAGSHWGKDSLIDLLKDRLRYEGREAEIAALVSEYGSPQQRAYQLLAQHDINGAIQIAQENFADRPGVMIFFADALVEAGASAEAESLIVPRAEAEKASLGLSYTYWLAEHYIKTQSWDEAWRWQLILCEQSLSEQYWEQLRFISERLDDWPRRRSDFEATLRKKKMSTALMRIALWENDASQALKLMGQLPKTETYGFAEPVALLAEKQFPESALQIYHDMATRAIERRSRPAYIEAVQTLKRMKNLHQRTKTMSAWESTAAALQESYKSLRAFQEEFRKANL